MSEAALFPRKVSFFIFKIFFFNFVSILCCIRIQIWIRNRIRFRFFNTAFFITRSKGIPPSSVVVDPDPQWFGSMDPNPDPHWDTNWIRIHNNAGTDNLLSQCLRTFFCFNYLLAMKMDYFDFFLTVLRGEEGGREDASVARDGRFIRIYRH